MVEPLGLAPAAAVTFSTAIQPPYNHHTAAVQSTKDDHPLQAKAPLSAPAKEAWREQPPGAKAIQTPPCAFIGDYLYTIYRAA